MIPLNRVQQGETLCETAAKTLRVLKTMWRQHGVVQDYHPLPPVSQATNKCELFAPLQTLQVTAAPDLSVHHN